MPISNKNCFPLHRRWEVGIRAGRGRYSLRGPKSIAADIRRLKFAEVAAYVARDAVSVAYGYDHFPPKMLFADYGLAAVEVVAIAADTKVLGRSFCYLSPNVLTIPDFVQVAKALA